MKIHKISNLPVEIECDNCHHKGTGNYILVINNFTLCNECYGHFQLMEELAE